MSNIKATIETRIAALMASEKTTHVELGHVSRELLIYVPETQDVGMVNRLIEVLTPVTRMAVIAFFSHFLPWKFDETARMFVGKLKGQKLDNKLAGIDAFLKDENANIWTWSKENITVKEREKNYSAQIAALVTRAKSDEKYGIDAEHIVNAVLLGGISLDDIMAIVTKAAEVRAAEQAKLAANENKPEEETPAVAAE